MKEYPILFSSPMVKAILDGNKTQSRRVVMSRSKKYPCFNIAEQHDGSFWPEYADDDFASRDDGGPHQISCPYGNVGSILYVRETWMPVASVGNKKNGWHHMIVHYKADPPDVAHKIYAPVSAMDKYSNSWEKYKPSIFMPKWAARLWLEITDVRVERLQEITIDDIKDEGLKYAKRSYHNPSEDQPDPWECFAQLWDSINRKRTGCSWADNPWCWCIGFRRIKP